MNATHMDCLPGVFRCRPIANLKKLAVLITRHTLFMVWQAYSNAFIFWPMVGQTTVWQCSSCVLAQKDAHIKAKICCIAYLRARKRSNKLSYIVKCSLSVD